MLLQSRDLFGQLGSLLLAVRLLHHLRALTGRSSRGRLCGHSRSRIGCCPRGHLLLGGTGRSSRGLGFLLSIDLRIRLSLRGRSRSSRGLGWVCLIPRGLSLGLRRSLLQTCCLGLRLGRLRLLLLLLGILDVLLGRMLRLYFLLFCLLLPARCCRIIEGHNFLEALFNADLGEPIHRGLVLASGRGSQAIGAFNFDALDDSEEAGQGNGCEVTRSHLF